MKFLNSILFLLLAISTISCSRSGGDEPPIIDEIVAPAPAPSPTTLIFPLDETECNTGVVLNETQSNVTFEWNASANTDSYELNIVNLENNNFIRSRVSQTNTTVTILRGTPYEWFVVSESSENSTTAASERWRFYNEGPGIENYAPFPAEAVLPARGINLPATTTEIILEWASTDIDNDIERYEVYFGTTRDEIELLLTTDLSNINNVMVSSGNTYFWRIKTIDSEENSSVSELFEFRIL